MLLLTYIILHRGNADTILHYQRFILQSLKYSINAEDFKETGEIRTLSAGQNPITIHLLSVNSYLVLEGNTRSCVLVGAKPSPAGRVHIRLKWHQCHPKWANDQIQSDAAMQRVLGLGCNRSQVQTLAVGSFLSPSLVCMFIFSAFPQFFYICYSCPFLFLMHARGSHAHAGSDGLA